MGLLCSRSEHWACNSVMSSRMRAARVTLSSRPKNWPSYFRLTYGSLIGTRPSAPPLTPTARPSGRHSVESTPPCVRPRSRSWSLNKNHSGRRTCWQESTPSIPNSSTSTRSRRSNVRALDLGVSSSGAGASHVGARRPRHLRSAAACVVADLVPGQVDGAVGDCSHRGRGGGPAPLRFGDSLSVYAVGRRRLDAAHAPRAGAIRSLGAVRPFLFFGSVAVGCLPRILLVLLRRLDGGMANRFREMGGADRPYLVRLSQPAHRLWGRRDSRLPVADLVFRAHRPRDELGPGARGPRGQTQGSRSPSAAFHQPLGVRLHAADANPNGGAVLRQRDRQTDRHGLVGRRRRMVGFRR